MTHLRPHSILPAFVGALAIAAGAFASDVDPPDLPGGKDSPLITRYTGSSLVAFADINFDQATLPLTKQVEDKQFVKAQTVEGKITRVAYLAPAGATVLEVVRNYQQALMKAGMTTKFSCEKEKCGSLAFKNHSSNMPTA